ncbi:MAG: hypothetical protein MHPSP_004469, partial [Paramarteilia canceri]
NNLGAVKVMEEIVQKINERFPNSQFFKHFDIGLESTNISDWVSSLISAISGEPDIAKSIIRNAFSDLNVVLMEKFGEDSVPPLETDIRDWANKLVLLIDQKNI